MHLRLLIFNIILFGFCGFLYAQTGIGDGFVPNISVYSDLLDKKLDVLENQFTLFGNDKVYCIKINANGDKSDFLYRKMRQKFNNYKLISDSDSLYSDFMLTFEKVKFETKYNKIFGSLIKNRKVQRRIDISFDCNLKRKNSDTILYGKDISGFNEDEYPLDRYEDVEKGGYEFLKGRLPEQSFWEKTFVPGIVIIASAVAIILFFEIRSK
jgi:hypothetical protein